MGSSQDIYQKYRANPEMLKKQGETGRRDGQGSTDSKKSRDELTRQVAFLTELVDEMGVQVRQASAEAARARKLAWAAILIAVALSAGVIAESIAAVTALFH